MLLADDEPAILFTFRTILEESGFDVESASSFQKAQESIRKNKYDAVISEYDLGREALGLELARQAKKRSLTPAVVLYSGHPTLARLRAALDLRVDYFAFQPIDLDEIKSALFRLISRRSESLS